MSSKKILIINFGGMGDIINTTPIATHYKKASKDCHVSFLTKSKYKHIICNNSQIDSILTLSLELDDYPPHPLSSRFKNQIGSSSLNVKDFDQIIFPAPYMWSCYDGTPKDRLLNIIKNGSSGIKEWNCDFIPHVELSLEEKNEANSFLSKLPEQPSIMIEYEFLSQQSFMDAKCIFAILSYYKDTGFNIIFSGKNKPEYLDRINAEFGLNSFHYDGSFMSNAELYNNIDLFISCSSGITCLTSSDYCNFEIPRIELVKGEHWSTKDFVHHKNKTIIYQINDIHPALERCILK